MKASLYGLEVNELLRLPGSSSWGGSFTNLDEVYNGDSSRLILIEVDGGNSEEDECNIIITCSFGMSQVRARIMDVSETINKQSLIDSMNQLTGKCWPDVLSQPLEYHEERIEERIRRKVSALGAANRLAATYSGIRLDGAAKVHETDYEGMKRAYAHRDILDAELKLLRMEQLPGRFPYDREELLKSIANNREKLLEG